MRRIGIERVTEPGREPCHDRLGVVARPVEAAVDDALGSRAQRVEERGGAQRRRGDPDRRRERQRPGREQHEGDEDQREEPGDDGVGNRAADQPVDLEEPVLEDPDAEPDRERGNRREAEPRELFEPSARPAESERGRQSEEADAATRE
jgi:hypothetical protein